MSSPPARAGQLGPIIFASALAASCTERAPQREAERLCDAPGAREVVQLLGERLKQVSLQAPDSIRVREIREAYASLVTPNLLEQWTSEPIRAPGRLVSSPWPERIEIDSVDSVGVGLCRVDGEVIYLTSVELTQGGAASREAVTLQVTKNGAWRISSYEVAGPAEIPTPALEAADVLRRYYAAIDARDYRRAYELWGSSGAASGQIFDEFRYGFSETARVEVEVGEPGRVEPAAGSRYIEVPVVVHAELRNGDAQRFEGSYVLRHSVVPGATEQQRHWHIYSAHINRVR